jgi:hypothetical protein
MILTLLLGSISFGPTTVARKMGFFKLSAKIQIALAPSFLGCALLGAALRDASGFLYGVSAAYALSSLVWWTLLPGIAAGSRGEREPIHE